MGIKHLASCQARPEYPINASSHSTSHSLLCWGVVIPFFLVKKVRNLPKDSQSLACRARKALILTRALSLLILPACCSLLGRQRERERPAPLPCPFWGSWKLRPPSQKPPKTSLPLPRVAALGMTSLGGDRRRNAVLEG